MDSALQAADDALSSAADITVKKTSKEVDEKFERAIEVLSHYETECPPKKPVSPDGRPMTVLERMAAAKAKDMSSLTTLKVLKEKLSLKVRSAPTTPPRTVLTTSVTVNHYKATDEEQPEPTAVVEFLLLKSLPDKCPTIVKRKCRVLDLILSLSGFTLLRQRWLDQHRIYKKFFGTSAASRTQDVSLSSRTLISTNSRISPHRGKPTWATSKPTQLTVFRMRRFAF